MDIPGVPQTINRDARNQLLESLGFDLDGLESVTFYDRSVRAVVWARDENGAPYMTDFSGRDKHEVTIRVVESE